MLAWPRKRMKTLSGSIRGSPSIRAGQITGFHLGGFSPGAETYTAVGTRPAGMADPAWQLVSDSLMVEGGGAPIPRVSIDGGEWRDLGITS